MKLLSVGQVWRDTMTKWSQKMGLAPGSTAEVSVTVSQKCLLSDRHDQSPGLQVFVIQLRRVKKSQPF